MMESSCPSCKSNAVTRLGKIHPTNRFAGKSYDSLFPGGNLYECNDCHLYFRSPRLSKKELDALYKAGSENNWEYEPRNRTDWNIALDWLNTQLSRGAVLDIGCFDGRFLEYLGQGWQPYGVEVNEMAIQRAEKRGIKIIAKNLDAIDRLSMQFDAVVAFDVIEHVEDPRHLLGQMARLTRTGGVMIISSGNTQASSWKFMGSTYWYCTFAEHISFVNEKWCSNTARALDLDLEHVERFSHLGSTRAISAIILDLTKNGLYKFAPGIFAMLRAIGFGRLDVKKHKEFRYYPPLWMSAKDHLIACFRKR